jgi:hypothetical protein
MSCHGHATCVHERKTLEERQRCERILYLIRRRPFATTEGVQKYKTVPDEHRAEDQRELLE